MKENEPTKTELRQRYEQFSQRLEQLKHMWKIKKAELDHIERMMDAVAANRYAINLQLYEGTKPTIVNHEEGTDTT